jgi:hypothetical protein
MGFLESRYRDQLSGYFVLKGTPEMERVSYGAQLLVSRCPQ